MIATDFLCWVPFSLICALHNLKAIDATEWYATFTMVALPINSVINPLLYDNTLKDMVTNKFKDLANEVGMTKSDVITQLSSLWTTSKNNQNEDQIEMEATPGSNTDNPIMDAGISRCKKIQRSQLTDYHANDGVQDDEHQGELQVSFFA